MIPFTYFHHYEEVVRGGKGVKRFVNVMDESGTGGLVVGVVVDGVVMVADGLGWYGCVRTSWLGGGWGLTGL